ncbi:glycoside hydrolase family 26 protein [Streptomyces tsukubensis]|uniref:Beta-mannanase n=1 Tax=Streptomyces tsukubensis TaxID=83656 RepID=A0A1V4A3V5_9ACTN|nr:glycosyl hydrolase [Streptomyces tsukubensis]OON74207.1 beta-mannanase [Streptomyces tsukubensis]QFR95270.1 beta-mannanase [Streptomyces tsukubensis]
MTFSPRRPLTAVLLAGALLAGTAGCSTFSDSGRSKYAQGEGKPAEDDDASASASSSAEAELPYDIRPLLHPDKKYYGLAAKGAPASMKSVKEFASSTGKKPNMIEFYSAWGDSYETTLAQNAWDYGALPFIAWEPFKRSLAGIAAGKDDAYIASYARSVKTLNQPVAISFAHEMNGFWYSWGTKKATPKEFVRAFRHVHDVFEKVGATQVIWVWSPNVINPMPKVRLEPYWPGDSYVDWVGVVGYYARTGPSTFPTLYGPTMDQIRAFTKKPFIVAETAAEAGDRKPADIKDLFQGVEKRDDVLGHVWFNFDKEADWRISSGPASARTYREQSRSSRYGFDVTKP